MRTLGKKGDLSLSVNAIVVLILAIVLLAFGLSFITKLLSKGESSLEGLFPSPEVQATSSKPIAMPDSILVKPGTTTKMSVNVLNTLSTPIPVGSALKITGSNCPNAEDVDYVSGTLPALNPGETGTLKLLINGKPSYKDNVICIVTIGTAPNQLSSSFFLTTKGSI